MAKEMNALFQILKGMNENKQGNADGQDGVDEDKIGKPHDDGTDQHHCPTQHILQHMQADGFLVQGIAAVGKIRCTEIDADPHHGKNDHTVIMDLYGVVYPSDCIGDD